MGADICNTNRYMQVARGKMVRSLAQDPAPGSRRSTNISSQQETTQYGNHQAR